MGMNLGGKKGGVSPTMNVTPLVDVALVVLIIFMVVTPMATKTFWLNLPKKEDKQDDEPPPSDEANKPLVMTVDREGAIHINQTLVQKHELAERLPRMLAAKRSKVLYFDAHDEAPFGAAAEAMDLSRQAGVRSIAMLTEKLVR